MIPALLVSPLMKLGVIAALVAGAYVTGCTHEKERFDQYKLMVAAVGEAQEAKTRERISKDKLRKKETDDAHKMALDRSRRERERLRGELARGSLVPAARSPAADPTRISFDRAELDRALRGFVEGTAGLVEEGDAGLIGLDAARMWGKDRQ